MKTDHDKNPHNIDAASSTLGFYDSSVINSHKGLDNTMRGENMEYT